MSALVAAARSYLGVPFRHRGRTRMGMDCAGVLWAAYRDCGVLLPDYRLYGTEPHEDGLVRHVRAALGDPVHEGRTDGRDLSVGDVVVMRFHTNPHHVALITDYIFGGLAMLHSSGETRRVIEHRLADDHIARVTHVFRRSV